MSRWAADEFACGSYSVLPVGATREDREELAKPVGALLFAGEATVTDYPSTVHGAYFSGLRAAAEARERVLAGQAAGKRQEGD